MTQGWGSVILILETWSEFLSLSPIHHLLFYSFGSSSPISGVFVFLYTNCLVSLSVCCLNCLRREGLINLLQALWQQPLLTSLSILLLFIAHPMCRNGLFIHLVHCSSLSHHKTKSLCPLSFHWLWFCLFQTCLPWSPWGREPRGRSLWLGPR